MVKENKEIIIELKGIKCEIGLNTIIFEKDNKKTEIKYSPINLVLEKTEKEIKIIPKNSKKKTKAILNSTAAHIKNAISGLEKEYTYKLAIVYSHFPLTAKVEGNNVVITNFLGEKKPIFAKILPGCKVEIKGRDIFVKGHNKYNVGQTAGNIEKITRVTKKDFRIFDDGCYIVEKAKQE